MYKTLTVAMLILFAPASYAICLVPASVADAYKASSFVANIRVVRSIEGVNGNVLDIAVREAWKISPEQRNALTLKVINRMGPSRLQPSRDYVVFLNPNAQGQLETNECTTVMEATPVYAVVRSLDRIRKPILNKALSTSEKGLFSAGSVPFENERASMCLRYTTTKKEFADCMGNNSQR